MTLDVIDTAAGLQAGDTLHATRRVRDKVVAATQASHDALLFEPLPGLSVADRLRVAAGACTAVGAASLAQHYQDQLLTLADASAPSSALPEMNSFATALMTDPRRGDRAAIARLKAAGLDDASIVALAQLVAFLSYQTRVVAGLQALRAAQPSTGSKT
jgi:uncharacterized protein YciW